MQKAVSCGGVVIFRGKILLLYKNIKNRYEGWVLPKGTVEEGESHEQSEYTFTVPSDTVEKEVHWYLMTANNYYSKPQKEEFFFHSGYYRYIEAYHLLKFPNERAMLEKAYKMYKERGEKSN